MQISNADFWADKWQEAANGSHFRNVYKDETHCWDTAALSYDKGLGADSHRVEAVMKMLNEVGFAPGGDRFVLDIGSGTGSFAIPFAQRGWSVDALDSSPEMNRVLRRKCQDNAVEGLHIMQADFNDYELADNSYDLVFGSMNPCLYNPQSFLRMLAITRNILVWIGIVDLRPNTGGDAIKPKKTLAELLTGFSAGHNGSNNIAYPFNLALALGLQPKVEYITMPLRKNELSPEEACQKLARQFDHLADEPDTSQIIADYVADNLENGSFIEKSGGTMGVVLCRKLRAADE